MKTFTIDTSIFLSVLLGEASRKEIIRITSEANLIAAASIDAEIGNALSANMKRGRITEDQALMAFRSFHGIPIRRVPLRLEPVMALCGRFSLYAYDAYVLDTAISKSTPLMTLDQRMIDLAKTMNITVIDL